MDKMSVLDLLLVIVFGVSAFGGYRRGALLQGLGLVGLAAGLVAAALAGVWLRGLVADPILQTSVVVAVVILGIAAGEAAGWAAGLWARRHVRTRIAARADAIGGAVLSTLSALLAVWFLAANILHAPVPVLSRTARGSAIVREIAERLPPPPPLVGSLERAAAFLGLPNVFAGLPPTPARPVTPPGSRSVRAAAKAAEASTVEVLSTGCSRWTLSEGSGFVVAPGYVVTNAHVVAGSSHEYVQSSQRLDATVVLMNPNLDVAVLWVPQLGAPVLRLDTADLPRGSDGAVLGYPGGQPLRVSAASLRTTFEAVGRNIYGNGVVRRRVYALQAAVHPGNSGGPFVVPDGRVAGIVFAGSTFDPHEAYALTAGRVASAIERGEQRTQPADTGACLAG